MKKSQLRQRLRLILKIVLLVHAGYIFLIAVIAINLRFWNPPVFSLMGYRYIFNGISPKSMSFVPITSIDKKYRRLIISTEDPSFYAHDGIDPMSMIQAAKVNHRYKTKLSGASTITQQLTRTIVLFPNKLYIRKYFEVIAAVTIDAIVPKERILELYFNYAEWGRGIYGINTASLYYYKHPVYRCTDDEVIRLITIMPSPVRYTPFNFWKRGRLADRYNRLHSALYYTPQIKPSPGNELETSPQIENNQEAEESDPMTDDSIGDLPEEN